MAIMVLCRLWPMQATTQHDDKLYESQNQPTPEWLRAALDGEFSGLDQWLGAQGYDPLRVAGLDFLQEQPLEKQAVVEHVEKLKRVQKPERMKQFLEKAVADVQSSSELNGCLDSDSLRVQDSSFSRSACSAEVLYRQ